MLTSEGARVNPEWLKGFLANPALSTTDTNRNGVRSYLQVRMPTFFFSDDEIRSLVLFFEAIVHQPQPFIPQKIQPLHHGGKRHGAGSVHQHGGSLPEVPCHRRPGPRQERHGAELPARQGAPAASLDRALDHQSGVDRSRHGHAFRPVQAGRRSLGILRAGAGKLQGYKGDQADLLVRYMFELTPEEQRALMGRTPSGGGSRWQLRSSSEFLTLA